MKTRRFIFILAIILFLTGCNFPVAFTATPEPTLESIPLPALTLGGLQNATYLAPSYNMSVALTDGKYETGSGLDFFSTVMQPEVAFGDLNADGLEDAAILLAENQGGTGVFVSLIAVLNQNGQPVQVGSAFVDDRPIINSLVIQDGAIVLAATIHGPNDPMVSPTFPVSKTFQLGETGLTLTRLTSTTEGGAERSITISDPPAGTEVSGYVVVKGSMPIAPFENNLVYRIFSQEGERLGMGSFLVTAEDMGAPATFDQPIDLSNIPLGIIIRIELVEKSPADGSTIAMNSVELMVK
jgi:hypothetical protein